MTFSGHSTRALWLVKDGEISRSQAAKPASMIRTEIRKISGRPPPTIPTAILIESGSVMRMAWQKNVD